MSKLHRAIGSIYEAAIEPAHWPETMQTIKDYLQVQTSQVNVCNTVTGEVEFVWTQDFDEPDLDKYFQYYVHIEHGYRYRRNKPAGTISASNFLIPDSKYKESEIYRDLFRHIDIFYTAGGSFIKDNERTAIIGVQRPTRSDPFTHDDLARLETLFPHLSRAFQVSARLGIAGRQQRALSSVLDELTVGVILLDAKGRAVYLNRSAEQFLAAQQVLALDRGFLRVRNPMHQEALDKKIHEVALTVRMEGTCPGQSWTVGNREGESSYEITVSPLKTDGTVTGFGRSGATAAVIIHQLPPKKSISLDMLRSALGLSPAEARLAGALADGRDLDEIAEGFHVSKNTVRAQLRAVFSKTGTRRQAELVKVLLTGPAFLSK